MGVSLRDAMLAATDAVEAAREALCALDADTGDGDHGVTMTIGARGVRRQLEAYPGDDPAGLVRAAAMGMAGAGGAIGPLYGRGLLAVAAVLDGGVDQAPVMGHGTHGPGGSASGDATRLELLSRCASAAAEAVAQLGHARLGDKTILDALLPVEAALAGAAGDGAPLAVGMEAARAAAIEGAEATAGMAAAVGRSSRFGERSRGTPDPGATSFAIIVGALVDATLASLATRAPLAAPDEAPA
jgi:dihydroxyacetone kinase